MAIEVNALSALRDRLSLIAPDGASAILPESPIALAEAGGADPRLLAESPPKPAALAWAILQKTKSPVPIAFDVNPFQAEARAYTDVSGVRRYLCLTRGALTHELFFHADPGAWQAKLRASGTNQEFTLQVCNAGNQELRADSPGEWSWLSTADAGSGTKFATAYYGIDRKLLIEVMQRQWGDVKTIYIGQGDAYYGPVPRALATSMWQEAQLDPASYVPDVFDCEDFTYAYKGTVCRRQLSDHKQAGIKYAYAVGCLQGVKSDPTTSGHAVNLFVDETFTTRVLEPQNGAISSAGAWGTSRVKSCSESAAGGCHEARPAQQLRTAPSGASSRPARASFSGDGIPAPAARTVCSCGGRGFPSLRGLL